MIKRLSIAAMLMVPTAALAADTSGPMADLANYFAMFLATVITGLVTWALNKYFGIKITQDAGSKVETAMANGIALGISKYAPAGIQTTDQKNNVLAAAMNYVETHVPDAADTVKAVGTVLAEKIEARLVQHPAAAIIAPATAALSPAS